MSADLTEKLATRFAKPLARLERMPPRERVVVTLCLCVVVWFGFNSFVIAPSERQIAMFGQLAATQREALSTASQELEGLRSGKVLPGDPSLREQLAALEKDNQSADASLRASQQYLVAPETMTALLQALLKRDKRLELVSMQTLPVAPIQDASKGDASAPEAEPTSAAPVAPQGAALKASSLLETSMFRHGVQLVLRGNFLTVLDYLHEVEKLPWQMYWGAFSMDVPDGGQPTYSLSIYTLSLDKSWLKL